MKKAFFIKVKRDRNKAFSDLGKKIFDEMIPKDANGLPVPGAPTKVDVSRAHERVVDELVRSGSGLAIEVAPSEDQATQAASADWLLNVPLSPGRIAEVACILEVSARKPGNVHPGLGFEDAVAVAHVVVRLPHPVEVDVDRLRLAPMRQGEDGAAHDRGGGDDRRQRLPWLPTRLTLGEPYFFSSLWQSSTNFLVPMKSI